MNEQVILSLETYDRMKFEFAVLSTRNNDYSKTIEKMQDDFNSLHERVVKIYKQTLDIVLKEQLYHIEKIGMPYHNEKIINVIPLEFVDMFGEEQILLDIKDKHEALKETEEE